jgi:hypothetical protein
VVKANISKKKKKWGLMWVDSYFAIRWLVINCRLFIKSPFYIIWELRLVVPSFQHFALIYFYSAWIYNAHFYLFLSSAWIRILFHLLHLHLPLFVNIWEHDISECSLWNIPAQSSNPWPLAWLTFLLNFKCSLLQRTLGWSHHKVLYSIIIFIIILKARTYFWLVYFLYVGKFSPYLKAPANQKNQEISHLRENSQRAASNLIYCLVIIVVDNHCKSELNIIILSSCCSF